ncbi:PEP-utilizing enzyme [Desertimonas flava]|uniref:PEP-utilizing enzyme n=1 Tax=Desertimonas flava TaxID=2064846 RepID=UPI000E340803|nr:PEP-utilizing enzyme [Desertimonas flava]
MEDRWITDWPTTGRWNHFTRANSGEVLPTPASPLGQQFTWDHGIVPGWRDGYVRVGACDLDEFDPELPEAVGFFGGYMYINLSNVRMQGVRSPVVTVEQLDVAFFGDHPDVPPHVPHPLDERPDLTAKMAEHLGWVMTTTSWPEWDDEREETISLRKRRPDLTTLTDEELVIHARSTQPMLQKLFESHTVTSSSSAIGPGILAAVGAAIGDPTIPMKLVAGIGDVDSAEPGYVLWDLSRRVRESPVLTAAFDEGVDGLLERLAGSDDAAAGDFLEHFGQFIGEYGSRGPNEWEISSETWETRPEIVLAALDRIRFQDDGESPRARHARLAAEREATAAEVRAKVSPLGEELAGQFEAALVAAHQLAARERTKTNIIRVVHEGRMVFRELGRRHFEAGHLLDPKHVFMLLDTEVEQFVADPASFTDTVADRYRAWRELWDLVPPFFIRDGVVPPLTSWARRGESDAVPAAVGDVLHGVSGSPGTFTGRARVITDPSAPGDLGPGDVLVAPLTDPAWTPLFMAVGAVVVDVGGQISHAIIVSRELGLPCVVSATGATERIPDGALVSVDADHGTVTILEVPK